MMEEIKMEKNERTQTCFVCLFGIVLPQLALEVSRPVCHAGTLGDCLWLAGCECVTVPEKLLNMAVSVIVYAVFRWEALKRLVLKRPP